MPSYTILYKTSEDSLKLFLIIAELIKNHILPLHSHGIKINTALVLHINILLIKDFQIKTSN